MYAKVFAQIFDSSIAEDYEVRHVFEDMLKLADRDGVVDMTLEAIARRTNVPLEKVVRGVGELMKADPNSRSKESEGRRLMPLDDRRDWGWIIVNYAHYRGLQDEESRREYFRNAKRRQRNGVGLEGTRGEAYRKGRRAVKKEQASVKGAEILGRQDQVAESLEEAQPRPAFGALSPSQAFAAPEKLFDEGENAG